MLYEEINPVIWKLKSELDLLKRELNNANRELEYLRQGPFSPKIDSWDNADIREVTVLPPRIELMPYGRGELEEISPYHYKVIAETIGENRYQSAFYADTSQSRTKDDAAFLLMSILERQAKKIADDY